MISMFSHSAAPPGRRVAGAFGIVGWSKASRVYPKPGRRQAAGATSAPLSRLTDREREALALIAEGRANRWIAERLGITTKTLEGMSGTIFSKLGLEEDPDVNRRVLAVLLYLDGAA
jgi:DNA-binding CsgD family transcriptional regulator